MYEDGTIMCCLFPHKCDRYHQVAAQKSVTLPRKPETPRTTTMTTASRDTAVPSPDHAAAALDARMAATFFLVVVLILWIVKKLTFWLRKGCDGTRCEADTKDVSKIAKDFGVGSSSAGDLLDGCSVDNRIDSDLSIHDYSNDSPANNRSNSGRRSKLHATKSSSGAAKASAAVQVPSKKQNDYDDCDTLVETFIRDVNLECKNDKTAAKPSSSSLTAAKREKRSRVDDDDDDDDEIECCTVNLNVSSEEFVPVEKTKPDPIILICKRRHRDSEQ